MTGIGRRRDRRTSAFGLNVGIKAGKIVVIAPQSRHASGHTTTARVQRHFGTSASPKSIGSAN